jgi:oligopeptide/dipeptide ABC transporter ATP-binding protein
MADEVAVMYAGGFIEVGDVGRIYREPRHPYTSALLSTLPRLNSPGGQLYAIPGSPPNLAELPEECAFLPRCSKATNHCRTTAAPELVAVGEDGQRVACYNPMFHDWDDD